MELTKERFLVEWSKQSDEEKGLHAFNAQVEIFSLSSSIESLEREKEEMTSEYGRTLEDVRGLRARLAASEARLLQAEQARKRVEEKVRRVLDYAQHTFVCRKTQPHLSGDKEECTCGLSSLAQIPARKQGRTRTMKSKGSKYRCLKPHNIDKKTWWYVEPRGKITLVHYPKESPTAIQLKLPRFFSCHHRSRKGLAQ